MIYIIASRYEIAREIAKTKEIPLNEWSFINELYQLKGLEAPEVILHDSAQDRKDWIEIETELKIRRAKISENWS